MTTRDLLERMPVEVGERLRVPSERPVAEGGRYVVYWMHHAVRGHENPALDAALLAAAALELPLLVYQGLGGGHAFDNDRHHTFILEGARDARAELAGRGVTHALFLGDDRARPSPLHGLAADAAVVVTEDFPAPPFPRWTARLAAATRAPVWLVDTACVVPMRLVGRAHDRAYRFREAIGDLLADRLRRPWTDAAVTPPAFDRSQLGFEDAALDRRDIAELVAECPIDHTVGPVGHTPGGSSAGYRRWNEFRAGGLGAYAARRNDASRLDGVSRLSPYLHHGQISPLRIAREAAEAGGKGADKFLDELIVWRELAHNLCFHDGARIESLEVLPEWARRTLTEHAGDDREAIYSRESLARGRTGDELWDLCQASLVRHGELHNNLRMTWGKAIVGWSPGPEGALDTLLDLNHRFALDGSDPNSYGGLLWCLGLFDRPFEPERPVLGSVRARPTAGHASRIDIDRYRRLVARPSGERHLRIAVIGAGISGLTCARTLADHGHEVRVFEKSRGPGGRMSTRREREWRFDHGAQYFTVRDRRFRRFVDSWRDDGLVARWNGRIAVLDSGSTVLKDDDTARYVAVPGMNGVCRHLASDLEVVPRTRVAPLEREGGEWRLRAEDGSDLGRYDAVVVSAPAPQTAALIEGVAPALGAAAAAIEMAPCWAVMAGLAEPLELPFDGAFVVGSPLRWVARNASKRGRPPQQSWVLHAGPEWSLEHLELDRDAAARRLWAAFCDDAGGLEVEPVHLEAHRWRFALPPEPLATPCLFDGDIVLAACGDWCGGPRVEGAFLSGAAAAGRILGLAARPAQPSLFSS